MTALTARQIEFCDKLKTVTNRSTGVRGLSYDNFSGYFTVRDQQGEFVDSFTDLTEVVLSRFSSGLFRAMFAMKEIENGKEDRRVPPRCG